MGTTRPEKSTENDKQGRYVAGSGPVSGPVVPANTFTKFQGDQIMAKNSKPVKGKKTGTVKPLMKRSDLPAVKPLIRL